METETLPDDLAVCHGMIRELAASLRDAHRQLEQLGHRLDLLLRRLYGPRSERVDPGQLLLFADGDEGDPGVVPTLESPAEPSAPSRTGRAKGHGRKALPADLPRERRVHEIPPEQRACPDCGLLRTQIGEGRSEQLDYRPASLFVVEHVRIKVACRHCQGHVAVAAKPPQPIEKGLPGPGLLAQVITSKFADHLPLYRQEGIFARHGVQDHERLDGPGGLAAGADLEGHEGGGAQVAGDPDGRHHRAGARSSPGSGPHRPALGLPRRSRAPVYHLRLHGRSLA